MIRFPSIPHMHEIYQLDNFVKRKIVIMEKLDGLNVLLHNGKTYTRDNAGAPHDAPYMAMVKKHHAHRTATLDKLIVFGEDLLAQHSCHYEPLREAETFFMFMTATEELYSEGFWEDKINVYRKNGEVKDFPSPRWEKRWLIREFDHTSFFHHPLYGFPKLAPVFFRGAFDTINDLRGYIEAVMKHCPSQIGGELEGLVVRIDTAFPVENISDYCFKVVRLNHVQPDAEHWRKNWKKRDIIWGAEDV